MGPQRMGFGTKVLAWSGHGGETPSYFLKPDKTDQKEKSLEKRWGESTKG